MTTFGFQSIDAAGNIRLAESRTVRLAGSYSITYPASTAFIDISIPGIANDGTWVVSIDHVTTFQATISANSVRLANPGTLADTTFVMTIYRV